MKAIQIISLILAIEFTANISAAPNPKPPPPPQDVNVVNTPNVTVTNPQTSVTVDNTTPIPVDVQGGITVRTERVFVGFSDITVNGNSGWPAVNAACRTKYGAGARICVDHEIYNNGGPVLPMSPDSIKGWITVTPLDQQDFYGGAPCTGFRDTGASTGDLLIDSDTGELKIMSPISEGRGSTIANCQSNLPVACCQ